MIPALPPELQERYRIGRVLGQGAFGYVISAEHRELGRPTALKVMPDRLFDRESRTRFEREARLTAGIRHPAVVQVYGYGSSGMTGWIEYELVDGSDLAAVLKRERGTPLEDALDWSVAIAEALVEVHAAGVVHRDLKPGNVMVRRDRTAVLCDFGLARAPQGATRLTEDGAVLGTPVYVAREVVLGEAAIPASDQFSWAAVVYELAYRQRLRPVRGGAMQLLMEVAGPVRHEFEAAVKGRYPALDACLGRALAPEPGQRFATTVEFRDALAAARRELLGAETTERRLAPVPEPEPRPVPRPGPPSEAPSVHPIPIGVGSEQAPPGGLGIRVAAASGLCLALALVPVLGSRAREEPVPVPVATGLATIREGSADPGTAPPGGTEPASFAAILEASRPFRRAWLRYAHTARSGDLEDPGESDRIAGIADPGFLESWRQLFEALLRHAEEGSPVPQGREQEFLDSVAHLPRQALDDLVTLRDRLELAALRRGPARFHESWPPAGSGHDLPPPSLDEVTLLRNDLQPMAESFLDRLERSPRDPRPEVLWIVCHLVRFIVPLRTPVWVGKVLAELQEIRDREQSARLVEGLNAMLNLRDQGRLPCMERRRIAGDVETLAATRQGEARVGLLGLAASERARILRLCAAESTDQDASRFSEALDRLAAMGSEAPAWVARQAAGCLNVLRVEYAFLDDSATLAPFRSRLEALARGPEDPQ